MTIQVQPTNDGKDQANQYFQPNHPDIWGVQLPEAISSLHTRGLLNGFPHSEEAKPEREAPCQRCDLKIIDCDGLWDESIW